MPEKYENTPLGEDQNNEEKEERFLSDTQKLVRHHLENEDHVITEEEMRNVRIGMTAPLDDATEEAIQDREDKVADRKTPEEDKIVPGSQKATPWDVIEPE